MTLSIVLPSYNESGAIAKTVRDVFVWMTSKKLKGEIIVVDDGSVDDTESILSSLKKSVPPLKVILHRHNKGYGAAIRTGCNIATSDIIAFMDSDGQFHVSELEKYLLHFPKVDLVSGIRAKRADSFIRWLNSNLFRIFIDYTLGIRVKDLDCGMKAFKKEIWPKIHPKYATGALFNAELFFNLKKHRLRFAEVAVHHYPRVSGHSTGANISVILKAFRDWFRMVTHEGNVKYMVYPVFRSQK